MDEMVLRVQRWLNQEYSLIQGFEKIPENGKTGWSTMYGLTRALQIELGIKNPVNNFGPSTASAYKNWGEMQLGSVPTNSKGKQIVYILQGACYCKGYHPGGFDGIFGQGLKTAVQNLQTDANLPVKDGKVYDYIFKAFLTMDAYKLTPSGNPKIREIQQALNYNYFTTAGVQPTDGFYQRNTNKALIYGLQTEIGIAPDKQTGSIGPATTAGLPILQVTSKGNFVKLFQYALYVNNYDTGDFDGIFGLNVKSKVIEFQNFIKLDADGIVGTQTWLSVLISTGDPNRKGQACDCVTKITLEKGLALQKAGYKTVGRYLVNVPVPGAINKKIQDGELKNIFDSGLNVFPIFQKYGNKQSSFFREQGKVDAQEAYNAAKIYGFPKDTTIYFAVDYDALGEDIESFIIPHFRGIQEQMSYLGNFFKVGVYGARNVCIRVSEEGLASTSFVSGMSTGFSGNLGYPLPSNWAFDQISTIKIGSGDSLIEIDNNIMSGKDTGASFVIAHTDLNEKFYKQLTQIQLLAMQYTNSDVHQANYLTTNYYRRIAYDDTLWTLTSGPFDKEFEKFVHESIGQNALIRFIDPIDKMNIDSVHLMATLSSLLYTIWPIVGVRMQDLSGWGGDLYTVAIDAFTSRESSEYTGTLEERTYQAAYDYIGTKTKDGNFTYEDFVADVDAVNIATILLSNTSKTIVDTIKEYYDNESANRYLKFFQNKFEGDESKLRAAAEEIMIGNDLDIETARQMLRGKNGMEVPYYSKSEGKMIAKAFSDKVLNLIHH